MLPTLNQKADINTYILGIPWWYRVKNLPANAADIGDRGSIPGSGRFPGV